MGDGSFNLEIGAALDKFEAQIGKVPAEVAAAASKAGKSLETLGKSGADSAKNTASQWDKAALKIGTALGSVFGGGKYVAATNNLAQGFEAMGESAEVLAPVLGVAALGLAALGAGAAGVVAVGKGLVDAVVQSDKLVDSLKPFRDAHIFPQIPADQIASVHAAKAAYDGLGVVWDEMTVQVGTEFAPEMTKLEKLMIEVGLAASDMVGDIIDDVEAFSKWRNALTPVQRGLLDTATLGATGALEIGSLADSVGTADDAFSGYSARADKLIGVQGQINDKLRDGGKAAKEYATWLSTLEQIGQLNAAATEDELDAQGKIDRAYMDQITALQKLGDEDAKRTETATQHAAVREALARTEAAIGADYAFKSAQAKADTDKKATDAQVAIAQRGADELAKMQADSAAIDEANAERKIAMAKKVRDIEISSAKDVANAAFGLADQILKNKVDTTKKGTQAHKAAVLAEFRLSQAQGLSQVGISTAEAVMNALATPVPYPVALGFSLAAGATGALEAAAILATPPPKAHGGELIDGRFPGEVDRRMTAGEAALSPRGRQAFGDDAIRAANDGMLGSGGPVRIQQVYGHKIFEMFVGDHLLLGGSLPKTIRKGDRPGERRRGRS